MSTQNIFDNEVFFNGYKALRESDANANDLIEQPAMRTLLPDLHGKAVLDLGCGYGHNCIDFVNRGAVRIVGVDISEKMLDVANRESAHAYITYKNMSMTDIATLGEKFDFIYSSLAFHYIKNFDAFAKQMYNVLNPNGQLLFSQEHPLTTATVDGAGHFNKNENGIRVSYTFADYNKPGERFVHWYVDGVQKYHRTFSDILNALANAGFLLEVLCEPHPQAWALEKKPAFYDEFIKPSFLIVKARNPQ